LTDLLIGRVFYEGVGRIFEDLLPALERSQMVAAPEPPAQPWPRL
jgi:hypothetical protein